jgi:hypothetical protein
MKRSIKVILIAIFLITAPLLILAQTPPHPNGGNNPGNGNGPVGGGAAIESGLYILIAMGAAYGANKLYKVRRNATLNL